MDRQLYIREFQNRYKGDPRMFRSPGRINIIGEHTDYNQGFVLPAAVDKEILVLMLPNESKQVNIYSIDEQESVSFALDHYTNLDSNWANYIIGIVDQVLKNDYQISGFNCVFGGNVPIGAGLSSSAALECATLFGINECFSLGLDKTQIALMAQRAENEFVGVNCGIMDQFASVFSKSSHAIKLDCRDLRYESYEIQFGDYDLILVDSMVKHDLASSEYNVRRHECEEAVRVLSASFPQIKSLRDSTLENLESVKNSLSDQVYARAKYIIEEIERVNLACSAIDKNDLKELGLLLYQTHEGLKSQYEISCEELDFLVDFTKDKKSVLGSRMMGGGFGGCTINLVHKSYHDAFAREIESSYFEKFNKTAEIYFVKTANGSSELEELVLDNEFPAG